MKTRAKLAIIAHRLPKAEYLVAWINPDMTVHSFCKGNYMSLQDAEKCAGHHLVNCPKTVNDITFINRILQFVKTPTGYKGGLNCPPGIKVVQRYPDSLFEQYSTIPAGTRFIYYSSEFIKTNREYKSSGYTWAVRDDGTMVTLSDRTLVTRLPGKEDKQHGY